MALVVVVMIAALILSVQGGGAQSPVGTNATAQARAANPLPYPDVPRISVTEAWEGMQAGQVLLVDVRSQQSYNTLHAEGAVSVPEAEISARLEELPRDQNIVLYCT